MRIRLSVIVLAAVASLATAPGLRADVTSDRAAAILIYPRVLASRVVSDNAGALITVSTDTLIQLSNTSNLPVQLHCFYVDATSYCSASGLACDPSLAGLAQCPTPQDFCLPKWIETDFHVVLTPQQPLAWRATTGLQRDDLPLGGALQGPRGGTNSGTAVPPVDVRPSTTTMPGVDTSLFTGELKCIVVDETGHGAPTNVVKGEATVVTSFTLDTPSEDANTPFASRYNAIGILAIEGDANRDDILELGGGVNEYNGCPNVLIAQHFFDGAQFLPNSMLTVFSELTLVPCTQDFRIQQPGSTTAQFVVFNEFEQRFSTSKRVDCILRSLLSSIDTNQPGRSIFSVGVAGTLAGQTRIRGVNQGLLGIVTEFNSLGDFRTLVSGDDAFNLGFQGDREAADRITLP